MKIHLGERIQALRKARGLTQEQLAQAMGVTVGAVSKWEKGSCCPDMQLLPELAEFFGTSVDVLLDYGWEKRGMGESAARIKAMGKEKRYDEAMDEAERALRHYPNAFAVVFESAAVFMHAGFERGDHARIRRAQALYTRALALMEQNTDEEISEVFIRCEIARSHLILGEYETAVALLRRDNVLHVNDREIGFCLRELGRQEEAREYTAKAFLHALFSLFNASVDVLNLLNGQGERGEKLAMCDWLLSLYGGLLPGTGESYAVKLLALLHAVKAAVLHEDGRVEEAEGSLAQALDCARRFDASPAGPESGIRFAPIRGYQFYDDTGETAEEGVRDIVRQQNSDALTAMLERVGREK